MGYKLIYDNRWKTGTKMTMQMKEWLRKYDGVIVDDIDYWLREVVEHVDELHAENRGRRVSGVSLRDTRFDGPQKWLMIDSHLVIRAIPC